MNEKGHIIYKKINNQICDGWKMTQNTRGRNSRWAFGFFPTTTITIRVRPLSDLFIRVYNGVTTYNYTYARLLAKYNKIT